MKNKILEPLEWQTVQRKVSDLIPYEYNPRSITDDDKDRLRRSLEKFNLVEIPVIDIDNTLIAGHQRIIIMFELSRGDEMIDVRIPNRKLTEEEFKEYNLRSNILNGEFDWEKIDEYFKDLELEDIGMDMIAFDDFIDQQMMEQVEEEGDFDDCIPDDPITQVGDLFEFLSIQKGLTHRVICGDSTQSETYALLLGNERLELLVTDPPYNVNYEGGTKEKLKIKNDNLSNDDFYKFLFDFFSNAYKYMISGAPAYVFYSDLEAINFRQAMLDAGFKISSVLIWVKNQFVLGRLDYHMKHEPILFTGTSTEENIKDHQPIMYGWNREGKHPWYSDRKQSSILEFDKPKRNGEHPTMKPIELLGHLIKNSSLQRQIVGDMFLGSGSTLIASEKNWRHCRGIEFDPRFVDVIVKRYVQYMRANHLEFIVKRNGTEMTKEEIEDFFAVLSQDEDA